MKDLGACADVALTTIHGGFAMNISRSSRRPPILQRLRQQISETL